MWRKLLCAIGIHSAKRVDHIFVYDHVWCECGADWYEPCDDTFKSCSRSGAKRGYLNF